MGKQKFCLLRFHMMDRPVSSYFFLFLPVSFNSFPFRFLSSPFFPFLKFSYFFLVYFPIFFLDFFMILGYIYTLLDLQSGWASRCRVCYQRGLPRRVCFVKYVFFLVFAENRTKSYLWRFHAQTVRGNGWGVFPSLPSFLSEGTKILFLFKMVLDYTSRGPRTVFRPWVSRLSNSSLQIFSLSLYRLLGRFSL